MKKPKASSNARARWLFIAVVGMLLAAPNASIIRATVSSVEPNVFNVYRYALIGVLTVPFLLWQLPRIPRRALGFGLQGGASMTIAVMTFVGAIAASQASYVAIITLITPMIFILLSARVTGEHINRRGIAGITLAALGSMLIVVLPIAMHQSAQITFYPLATLLILINCVTFPFATIRYKQANEAGMSLMAITGLTALLVVTVSLLVGLPMHGAAAFTDIPTKAWWGIAYCGLIIGLVHRMLSVLVYEKIGSVTSAGFGYLEIFLSVLIPVFWLHEQLSVTTVLGGVLILSGVIVAEHHTSAHHKHFHLHRHH